MDAFTKPIWFNVYKNSVPKCLFYVTLNVPCLSNTAERVLVPFTCKSLHWPERDYRKHTYKNSEKKKQKTKELKTNLESRKHTRMSKVRDEDFRCQCYSSKSDTFVQYCYVFYVYKYFCKDKMFISPWNKQHSVCVTTWFLQVAIVNGMLSNCSLRLRWNYRYAFYFTGVQA